jgi:ABC-type multidrug transport system ATPase subunit/ABC-type multidrug transport system permease subunit
MLNLRNKQLILPRIAQAIFMGLIMGTLFFQVSQDAVATKAGLLLFGVMFCGFGNMAEIPIAIDSKNVVQKQYGYGLFPLSTYLLAVVICHMPLVILETIIFGSVIYWLSGLATNAGVFLFFLLVVFCTGLAMSTWFRFLAYSSPNMESGQLLAGPSTAIFMLFSGFLITYSNIPNWLIWLYWLSPFSWALRSLMQNEFFSPSYRGPCSYSPNNTEGECALQFFDFQINHAYQWSGVGMLLFYFFLFMWFGYKFLPRRHYVASGTKRANHDEEEQIKKTKHEAHSKKTTEVGDGGSIELASRKSRAGAETVINDGHAEAPLDIERGFLSGSLERTDLPHKEITLAFSDLEYEVTIPTKAGTVDSQGRTIKKIKRKLLRGITGYAKPRELTALMGASGAGKTTLMDVISGRTTSGTITGEILVNGRPKNPAEFSRVMGYVEQQDLHIGLCTVEEALTFSAKLRLPTSADARTRQLFVKEIMADLELTSLANRIIGDREAGIAGLSPGQVKRVTIGVELVANPGILFLDEPTSGLDSREALQVVEVIRKIARKGRTVVCTIHQPAAEVFLKFDKLILLQTGGHQVFFGDIGEHGSSLVKYFHSVQKKRCSPRANPASWMLEILAEEDKKSLDYSFFGSLYRESPLARQNAEETSQTLAQTEQQSSTTNDYPTAWEQYKELQKRHLQTAWRNLDLNQKRITLMFFLGIVFGLVYLHISTSTYAGTFSKLSVILMTSAFCGVIMAATALPVVARERAVYYREQSTRMYSAVLYSVSIGIAEIPFVAICTIAFVTPYYFMVGMENDAGKFFTYLLGHYLLSLTFVSVSQTLSEVLPDIMVANIIQGVFFSFTILFGGLFIQGGNIPQGWQWFYAVINWVPKAFKALALSQFQDQTHCIQIPPGSQPSVPPCTELASIRINDFVSDFLAAPYKGGGEVWLQLLYLVITIFVFRVLIALAVKYVRHITR